MQVSSEFSRVNAKIGFGHYPGCDVQPFKKKFGSGRDEVEFGIWAPGLRQGGHVVGGRELLNSSRAVTL